MQINGQSIQSIGYKPETDTVQIIDQRKLPFHFELVELHTLEDAYRAISDMLVRGAPLIGVTAAYGLYLGLDWKKPTSFEALTAMGNYLKSSRPTAVNLARVVDDILENLQAIDAGKLKEASLKQAQKWEALEIQNCENIGTYGLPLIEAFAQKNPGKPVQVLTHCNAGWLACVAWGTALAPIYKAHLKGIPVHVWVDETRPRNQGARLTAWELQQAGVPYTVIADNTGGHLMQKGLVDLVIVGSDRTTRNGDVANKIGTYLKALAAKDNAVPFYVALPSSSIDFTMDDGLKNIPIEQRDGSELTQMEVKIDHKIKTAYLMDENTPTANYGFDVTPARLVSGLITEKGLCKASEQGITQLFKQNHD